MRGIKGNSRIADARLICLALSAVGLLVISLVLRGVDQGPCLSASFNAFAEPTPCRLAVGAALQAEATDAPDAETPRSHPEQAV